MNLKNKNNFIYTGRGGRDGGRGGRGRDGGRGGGRGGGFSKPRVDINNVGSK